MAWPGPWLAKPDPMVAFDAYFDGTDATRYRRALERLLGPAPLGELAGDAAVRLADADVAHFRTDWLGGGFWADGSRLEQGLRATLAAALATALADGDRPDGLRRIQMVWLGDGPEGGRVGYTVDAASVTVVIHTPTPRGAATEPGHAAVAEPDDRSVELSGDTGPDVVTITSVEVVEGGGYRILGADGAVVAELDERGGLR